MKNIILTERDRKIMFVLDKLGYTSVAEIMILCGFVGNVACRRRLRLLYDNGYIKIDKYELKNIYTLTAKGYAEIEKHSKVLEINQGTRHQLNVGSVIAYLMQNQKINLENIKSDRELRAERENLNGIKEKHIPDIVVSQDGINHAFEVELTSKTQERLKKNIKANLQRYDAQYWIVPINRPVLKENIRKIARELMAEQRIKVFDLEEITNFLAEKSYPKR